MIDVNHGLLLVWGEEPIRLLDGALSIFPAWLGFDTVLRFSYSLVSFVFIYRQRGIVFMVVMVRHLRYLKKNLAISRFIIKITQSQDHKISRD